MICMRHLLFAFCSLLLAHTAQAQFEIQLDPTNVLDPRCAGAAVTGITSGKVDATKITITSPGGSYSAPPLVVIGPPASGSTARVTATISGGIVTGFTIVDGGSGYTAGSLPTIRIAPPTILVLGTTTGTPNSGWSSTSGSSAAYRAAAVDNVQPELASYLPNNLVKTGTWPPTLLVTATIILEASSFGDSFGSTPTLYFLGDVIPPPTLDWNDVPLDVTATNYWRTNPVEPGETFSAVAAGTVLPDVGNVTITQSSTTSSKVTVVSTPDNLVTGATLLGQRVNFISGTSVTLAGNANRTIASATAITFAPYQPYYYSPHANRVFATQAGRVVITWVTTAPDTSEAGEQVPTYKFRQESFVVSSASRNPQDARSIFWTEKGFRSPLVMVPEGKIVRANPVYNTFVPGMTTEYVPVGSNPNGDTSNGEQRTLWYDKENGPASLHAYNVEGRIFIEYLGKEKVGSTGIHEFLGADLLDIHRVAEVATVPTYLGERLKPRTGFPEEGDDQLIPAVQFNTAQVGKALYGDYLRPDGISDYYAERENLDPDLVTIYWLEKKDAAIHFLAAPSAPGLSINWPKLKRNYTQTWPPTLASYEPVNVEDTGNSVATALQFAATSLPEVIFQDDPTEQETSVNAETQRLLVDFAASADKTNRSMLKFSSSAGPWYVRLFIQSQTLLGSPAVIDTDGAGPIIAMPAVSTLNDSNADGIADNDLAANVGDRLEPPSNGYELGGYITSGLCYSEAAYINPFVSGVAAASAGAIIPVNALSADRNLGVWWFKQVRAPSSKFESFYVPAVKANYLISYPDASYTVTTRTAQSYTVGTVLTLPNTLLFATARAPSGSYVVTSVTNSTTFVMQRQQQPQELVIASTLGLENPSLTSVQAAGNIYVQNDATKIGYNPNEEHALLLDGNAYALRSDLNTSTSSEPYVLIQYNEAASSRPAMRIAKVFKETVTYPLVYDKIAGTPAQPPMPLTGLPIPLQKDGHTVRNKEVRLAPDTAAGAGAPTDYNSFTFVDRKGVHWIYRGPHNGGAPTFGMKFYYYLQAGFYFPGMTKQPAVGSVQPFVAADIGKPLDSGDAVTLTYKPKWPDDPSLPAATRANIKVGTLFTGQTLTLAAGEGLPQVRGQASAQVLYQQSIANRGSSNDSVFLQDPTRQKTINLDDARVGLTALPKALLTSLYAGKTYFQQLPPHLQNRFYFDPTKGTKGALVLTGEFIDVTVGVDYLNLNALSFADVTALKNLCSGASPAEITKWNAAIDGLSTTLETFKLNEPATAEASLTGGKVASAQVLYPGWGYSFAPTVTFSAPPQGGVLATGTATMVAGKVTAVTVTKQGSGYVDPPTLIFSAPPAGKSVDVALDHRTLLTQQLPDIRHPDTAVDSYALSTTGKDSGYVTLVFGNGKCFTDAGDPVVMQIIKVDPTIYPGDLKVLLASNPLDEQVVLRHSGDYSARPENFVFQWRYGFPTSGLPPTGDKTSGPNWIDPLIPNLGSSVLVGGSPAAVLSTPAVLMADTYFTMRYKKVGAPDSDYSTWDSPVLVEGWIKRVLAKINPFNQRMDNLYNSSVNTDVSLLTQAGKRWEGDIALNLENINDAGLIEIYETVLNRGKSFTIGSGIDFNSANNALILAAGYLNDLYTILGNEAYADAANPTISIDDQTSVTEVNTSRFSFEGQVSSSLDEELSLLRGRDDFGSPAVSLTPAYNRLFWNYTRGINSGEVLYAVNYNIKEKSGSSTADGKLDAADAQRMFPQGHGDAYGHYLTAIKGYYKLLNHPYFTWTPQAEAVTVLGQAVLVDYKDERKFAAAAGNISRTAAQIVSLVHRQSYQDDPASGWSQFRDGKPNPITGTERHQGLDEWESRAAQGSYLNWIVGNAMLPSVDTNPAHTGVQIIDRTTVPELNELVASADTFQSGMDLANAHLNPLGLSPGAIAFDISPTELRAGSSHYDQVNARALRAVLNAKGSFDQAAKMTRLLRNQENQIGSEQEAIEDQEKAYVKQLKEIYGSPYGGDIGAGKAYAQGYAGPDTERWFIIDRPTDLVNTTVPVTVNIRVPTQVRGFTGNAITDIVNSYNTINTVAKSVTIAPNQFAQFATVLEPSGSLGSRPQTGSLQKALMESYLAQVALLEANQDLQVLQKRFQRGGEVFQGLVQSHVDQITEKKEAGSKIAVLNAAAGVLSAIGEKIGVANEVTIQTAAAVAETLPTAAGTSIDATAPARGAIKAAVTGISLSTKLAKVALQAAAMVLRAKAGSLASELERTLLEIGFNQQELQAASDFERVYYELANQQYHLATLMAELQNANQNVTNLSTSGQRVLVERETFRNRAAAVITGYRTKDLTFRTFRNEALEQYRTLFDLAGRYSYLAAKSYDYETGLLGTPEGKAVINKIVSSRALGDLTGGVPQATVSTLGDSGLAGTMAQLNADFSVAKGRLGINNPDQYGTLFSMRHELYRLLDDPAKTDDDVAWQQTLEQAIVPNLMADPDVVKQCNNIRKPDGSAVPGLLISFSTSIEHGKNFFGLSTAAGDHNYSPSSYATKISSVGLVFPGYVGMDPYAFGNPTAGGPNSSDPNSLNATPYAYLIPCGTDYMLAPPLGDTNTLRSWDVHDQALPLPYNLGASAFNTTQFFTADGTLSEQPWLLRKHQAFRPVSTQAFFYSSIPAEFTNSRLVARSVWNSEWKIVIPAYTLLNNETDGLNRFVRSVKDIQLFLRTYSHSGN